MREGSTDRPEDLDRVERARAKVRRYQAKIKEGGRAHATFDLSCDLIHVLNGLARTARKRRSLVVERLLRQALLINDDHQEGKTSAA